MKLPTSTFPLFALAAVLLGVVAGHILPMAGAAGPQGFALLGLVGMTSLMLEGSHLEMGLAAVADAFAGTVYSDVLNMKLYGRARFFYHWGVGTTGTMTITVEACDNTTPSNVSAVAFRYRVTVAGSTPGAWTAATSAGFTTTAGSNQIIEIEVLAEALLASGYSYIRSKSVEVVNDPILGGILVELCDPIYAGDPLASATL